jgi:hypothetical protein
MNKPALFGHNILFEHAKETLLKAFAPRHAGIAPAIICPEKRIQKPGVRIKSSL